MSRQPDLAWYTDVSRRDGLLPRCPFASVERCPRFYQSVWALGESGFTTRLPADDDRRLQAAWQKTDVWPRMDEHKSAVMGWAEDPRHFLNFCPEVLFERFGVFASGLHGYASESDRDAAHARLGKESAVSSDWRWSWSPVTPMHYRECPLYSPLMKDGPGHVPLGVSTMNAAQSELDSFRIAVGVIQDSDTLVRVGHAAGLRFDAGLSEPESYSHKTRLRALLPRVLGAYDGLDSDARLVAARAAVAELRRAGPEVEAALAEALARAGWELQDGDLAVRAPETREVFFPKGSPWDAFVVLRDLFAEARQSITIVDAYCDTTVFQILEERSLEKLHIRILCSQYASAVAAGAKAFVAQHPEVTVEVRKTRDFHDRFVVLDGQTCIHVGASIKDAGKAAFMVSRIEDRRNREALLKQLDESWLAGIQAT